MSRGPSPTPRCQALDADAKQCRRHKTRRYYYHGDPEIVGYRERAEWVAVWLCGHHSAGMGLADGNTDEAQS